MYVLFYSFIFNIFFYRPKQIVSPFVRLVYFSQNIQFSGTHLRQVVAILLEVCMCVCITDRIFKHCLFYFSTSPPCQRPLSAAYPAWPLPVPTVYWDCHQTHGGRNKGGSVLIVLSRIVSPSLGTNRTEGWGLFEEHWGHLTSPDLQKGHENETMRKSKESEKERKMYSYNPEPFKSSIGNCCYVNTCSH